MGQVAARDDADGVVVLIHHHNVPARRRNTASRCALGATGCGISNMTQRLQLMWPHRAAPTLKLTSAKPSSIQCIKPTVATG